MFRAPTSIASILRPSSEVIIRRNLISIDAVQLPSLDDDSSDDSDDVDDEDDGVEPTSCEPRASLSLVYEPPEHGLMSIESTMVSR